MSELSVKSELKGDVAVVSPSGRVDSVTAAMLEKELEKALRNSKRIVLDLKAVKYLSSAGVRAILKASQDTKKSGGGVRLARIPAQVIETLENVGVIQLLQTFASLEDAVASF